MDEYQEPERCLCGNSVSEDELHDSNIVGSLPRCRECLEELGLAA